MLKDLDVRRVAVVSSNPEPNNPISFRLYWGHHAIEKKITRFEKTLLPLLTKAPT